MKTKSLLILLCLVTFATSRVKAQQKGMTGLFGVQNSFASLNNRSEFKGFEFYLSPGYNFNKRFVARVQAEMAIAHFKVNNVKNYENNGTFGLGGGYYIFNNAEESLELSVTAGNTLGGSDWQYLYIDSGLKWAFGRERTRMYFGAGMRYYNSHRTRFDNYFNAYATLGFRIN